MPYFSLWHFSGLTIFRNSLGVMISKSQLASFVSISFSLFSTFPIIFRHWQPIKPFSGYRALSFQFRNLLLTISCPTQDLICIGARRVLPTGNNGRRTAELRRRCRLRIAVDLYVCLAGLTMWMVRRLRCAQHWRKAGICAFE